MFGVNKKVEKLIKENDELKARIEELERKIDNIYALINDFDNTLECISKDVSALENSQI